MDTLVVAVVVVVVVVVVINDAVDRILVFFLVTPSLPFGRGNEMVWTEILRSAFMYCNYCQ